MRKFAWGIVAGAVSVFGGLAAAYGAIATIWPDNLPAPAITRLVLFDEKLRFLRQHPEASPTILAVGSSITWRQLDGNAFDGMTRGTAGGFLNGATGHLRVHQTQDLVEFYLDQYLAVRTVLIMTGPPDFADCSTEPAAMLDHSDGAAYAFGDWPAAYFYFRYFAPQRYARTAWTLAERRDPMVGDLFLDDYGSGPLQVPESKQHGLRYGLIDLDPACSGVLARLSQTLTAQDRGLVVVFTPIHPDYRLQYPDVVAWLDRVARELARATSTDNTVVLRLNASPAYEEADFFDAFHLQWPAVQRLSTDIVQAIAADPRLGAVEMSKAAARTRPAASPSPM